MLNDLANVEATLRGFSDTFTGMTANGLFNGSHLSYSGADSVAVFDLNAVDVFAQNNSLSLDAGVADTVIINVAGTNVSIAGGVNLTGNGFSIHANGSNLGASNILWNFHEAESINFNNLATVGSVLALDADIVGGAVFDGAVAAQSYDGGSEFHRFAFNWTPPQVEVPEAPTALLFSLGLCLILGSRKRR